MPFGEYIFSFFLLFLLFLDFTTNFAENCLKFVDDLMSEFMMSRCNLAGLVVVHVGKKFAYSCPKPNFMETLHLAAGWCSPNILMNGF